MKQFLLLLAGLAALPAAGQTISRIGAIRGTGGAATPGVYTVQATVTAVYPGLSPAGYYVQEEPADSDADPATSDALFVVQTSPAVAVGSRLRITGTVQENSSAPSFFQAVLINPVVTTLSTGNALPPFTTIDNATFSVGASERYEGMLVQFSAPLTVTDVRAVRSRGELTLGTNGLAYQPTQLVDPNDDPASGTSSAGASNVAAVTAFGQATATRLLTLDDGSAATNPSPTPYLDAATGTVRIGSTVAGLRGVMGYGSGRFRLQPLPGANSPVVTVVRPPVPTFGPLDVKLASFNVLNYFNGDGLGGGFPTSRGASTPADFARQRAKIIVAIAQMNADAVGLVEIENDGIGPNSAIQDLVSGLNQALGAGTYAVVDDGFGRQANTTDLIRCAIIYKPAALTPVGNPLLAVGPFERAPLAQRFTVNRTAPRDTFALVVNHFKSKASGTGVNADQGDGQGPSNLRRKTQSEGLVLFINNVVRPAGTRHVVSVGDYNAHYEEDPMDILRAAGLRVSGPPTSTSYAFNGLSGSLDYAVLTPSLDGRAEVRKWNINAPEPEFLEYSLAGAATDVGSPFRSSDHDPVLIGLNFSGLATAAAAGAAAPGLLVYPNPATGPVQFVVSNAPAGTLHLELVSAQGQVVLALSGTAEALQAQLRQGTALLAPGLYLLHLTGRGLNRIERVVKQ